MTTTSSDPFGVYTDEAAYFDDLPHGELEEYLRRRLIWRVCGSR